LSLRDIGGKAMLDLLHGEENPLASFSKDIPLGSQLIVGARFQGGADDLLRDLKTGKHVTLMREPDNRFDPKAVMVLDDGGRRIGYIPRDSNETVSALLDAGKYIYGIVSKDALRHINPLAVRRFGLPTTIEIDLFMREFSMPGDMTSIPRQGSDGSYAVMDIILESGKISSICAIKVINGDQRGIFQEEVKDPADLVQERETMLAFYGFIGYLPIVCHGITGKMEDLLAEAYGIALGKPFSNTVIDTEKMAENHLPKAPDYSLEGLADYLGIEADGIDPQEQNCRITWQLYRRMDKSQLERKKDAASGDDDVNSP
jgi:hypothetical protein